ncbi:MAG: aldo/keto reductase, partial [Chloroflexota bacterium]
MTGLADIQMGIGAASWGRSLLWHYGRTHTEHDIRAAFDVISASPGVMIDTAELYGLGQSESYIGQFATEQEHHPPVATKCFPYPWRWTGTVLLDAVRSSLRRLNHAQIDLYQMHWPFPPVKIPQWMEAMAQAAEEGLVRAVGVSNYSIQQTQLAFDTLAKYGVQLASNQVKYNLLDRTIERNGLLDLCNRLGVRIIAYSPLQLGLLTGKYTPANPPTGLRG